MKKIFEYRFEDGCGESLTVGDLSFVDTTATCTRPISLIYQQLMKKFPRVAEEFRRLVTLSMTHPASPVFSAPPDNESFSGVNLCMIYDPEHGGKEK